MVTRTIADQPISRFSRRRVLPDRGLCPEHPASATTKRRWAANAGKDGRIRLWDLEARESWKTSVLLQGYTADVNFIEFSRDERERWIISGSEGGTARLWSLEWDNIVDQASTKEDRNLTRQE